MPYAFTNANDWKLMNALVITFQSWVEEPDPYTGSTKKNTRLSGTCSLGMKTNMRVSLAVFYSSI
jgi:hypothetical protein